MDIGCGDGYLLHKIHSLFNINKWNLFGLDISETAIKNGNNNYGLSKLLSIDATKWKNIDTFDLVLSYGSLEHIKETEKIFKAIKNMLNTNGYFIFMIPTLKYYREDRDDEGWYEDLDINKQLQWNRYRESWEKFFISNNLKLFPIEVSIKYGAIKTGYFYIGQKT